MSVTISDFNHDDDELWRLLGRYFASPAVRRELGRSMSSTPAYHWWVALDGDSVAGFGAVKTGKSYAELCHAYVLPDYRGQGIYSELLSARIQYCAGRFAQVKAIATDKSRPALEACGFRQVGNRGRYAVMRLRAD